MSLNCNNNYNELAMHAKTKIHCYVTEQYFVGKRPIKWDKIYHKNYVQEIRSHFNLRNLAMDNLFVRRDGLKADNPHPHQKKNLYN